MDIATFFDGSDLTSDYRLAAGDLQSETGLKAAVVISLFTNARLPDGQPLPDGMTDRQGWWGDLVAPAQADNSTPWVTGSLLWTLSREKQTDETARRARDYAYQALTWMLRLAVAKRLSVTAEWIDRGLLALAIDIDRPDGVSLRYDLVWKGQEANP